MTDTNSWIVYPTEYPVPRAMHLAAIGDTVPVYTGHVRLVRDLTIGQESEIKSRLGADRTLALEGAFYYQACHEKECFLPRTIPLRLTFRIGELETERVPAALQRKPR